ncbi:Ies4p LALA0_S07e00914g [Lachancea lanzarotensis]|uniref:LALA0S07e00914g1_1 n=1 Tax=Lachancea lanzarotensis TaxID=1245769 RepID=A0A0C7NBX7_9SACH|nr:uncharacterized protein LALA0_S07e00914g [Lachancea lanzarotensis]CEP63034.1 LALA0S07e00914g1_1 [Lachancea lanzarotensis]
MSQDHPDAEPAPSSKGSAEASAEAAKPSKSVAESFPTLEWQQVDSSIPVESFTNYKIRLTGWSRKDQLKKRLEQETQLREEEQAKKQRLQQEQEEQEQEEEEVEEEESNKVKSEHNSPEKNGNAHEEPANGIESENDEKVEEKEDAGTAAGGEKAADPTEADEEA